jgi:hypothetical protein
VSEVLAELLTEWNIRQRFGAVGKHGSIELLDDFSEYYNHWRGHSTIGGALPSVIHRGDRWQRPDRSSKTLSGAIERRLFPDARITAFRLAA